MTENESINYLRQIDPKHIECVELIDMKEVWENIPKAVSVAEKALREIQQYRSIGAVEECREARERCKEKKWERGIDKDVRCPICGTYTADIFEHRYCTYCGQRLV